MSTEASSRSILSPEQTTKRISFVHISSPLRIANVMIENLQRYLISFICDIFNWRLVICQNLLERIKMILLQPLSTREVQQPRNNHEVSPERTFVLGPPDSPLTLLRDAVSKRQTCKNSRSLSSRILSGVKNRACCSINNSL